MRKSHLLSRSTTWKLVAAVGVSPLMFAADASAQSIAISLGLRESNAGAPIGGNGLASGGIEWVNLDGQFLVLDGTWQQFTFNFQSDPLTAFAGATANGMYDFTNGAIEHIRFRNTAGTTSPITVYLDDIVNTVSGSPTTVTGFESTDPFPATLGAQHAFWQPGFSGSTSPFLQATPNQSIVTDEDAHSGDQSLRVRWAWNSSASTNWLRLTTNNHPNQPNPAIDYSNGNTLSFWLKGTVEMPANFWQGPSGGNWNDPGNWSTGEPPNSTTAVANLLQRPAPTTINLDQFTTVNAIIFNSPAPNGYTISGTETLSLNGTAGLPRSLNVEAGNHVISTPIEIITPVQGPLAPTPVWAINTTGVNDTLTTSGTITLFNAGTLNIDKSGQGTWITSRIDSVDDEFLPVTLRVLGGTMRLAPGGGTSRVQSVFISGGTTPTAKLDITNNAFVIDYNPSIDPPIPSPLQTVRQQIAAGYNGGAWDGNGIVSSQANANNFGIGYAEASELPSVPAIFGTVDADALLLRLTRYGDTNLDGVVNLADFNALAANFGSTEAVWRLGDFNYDGIVNLTDFNRLAANFGLSAAGPDVTPDDWAALAAAVPEPGMLSLIGLAALPLMRRRRGR